MLRDRTGHSSIFTTVGVRLGDIQVDSHVGSGGVQDGCPGSSAWRQHSSSVNPARRHPVQLATRAGSTQHPALLISFSIQVLCTRLCTRYVHKKSAKTASNLRSRSLVYVVFFSVHPLGFRLTNRRVIWWQKHQNSHRRLQNQEFKR